MSYNKPPQGVTLDLQPFTISIPDADIEELKTLIKLSRVPKETYENSGKSKEKYGLTRDWFIKAKEAWVDFDWRKQEQRINQQPQFTTKVTNHDGHEYTTHFMALFSTKADAIPIVLCNGWPSCFLEFLPLFELVRKQYSADELPYHLIVPSLPGYTFSESPRVEEDFGYKDLAVLTNGLMTGLGFKEYIGQGGDIGSGTIDGLANFPGCKAIHANNRYAVSSPPEGTPEYEQAKNAPKSSGNPIQAMLQFGYALEQGTKPGTIGLSLGSSPTALLAWIGEKYLAGSDPQIDLETILTFTSLWWFTDTYPSSIYIYKYFMGAKAPDSKPAFHKKPVGYSRMQRDLMPIPIHWVEKAYNLVWSRDHDRGGHFAFLEQTEMLWDDLEDFVKQVWKV